MGLDPGELCPQALSLLAIPEQLQLPSTNTHHAYMHTHPVLVCPLLVIGSECSCQPGQNTQKSRHRLVNKAVRGPGGPSPANHRAVYTDSSNTHRRQTVHPPKEGLRMWNNPSAANPPCPPFPSSPPPRLTRAENMEIIGGRLSPLSYQVQLRKHVGMSCVAALSILARLRSGRLFGIPTSGGGPSNLIAHHTLIHSLCGPGQAMFPSF
jgi:hypothetical protein